MAAASFLAARATLFGRARAPPGAREFARTPCAVARARFVQRHEAAARFATCRSRARLGPLTIGPLSASSHGFRALVSTRASGDDTEADAKAPEDASSFGVVAADDASSAPPPSDDAPSEDDAARAAETDAPPTFAELGLPKSLCAALEAVGFEEPSLPQRAAIPALLAGDNVALQSHTGSGKTMAYLLPVIARIIEEENLPASERSSEVRCLVVVPSQELAMQIVRQVERVLGEFGKSITQQCIGGANVRRQEEAIRRKKPLVVVGTPGRLAELSRNGILRTHGVRCLVIDEADDLLASNFRRDMARICDHTGKGVLGGRQTVVVSATLRRETLQQYEYMAPNMKQISAGQFMERASVEASADGGVGIAGAGDGAEIERSPSSAALPPNLEHYSVTAEARHKVDRLRSAIHATGAERALVFLNFGHRLVDVRDKLATRGMACGVLHGGMNKMERAAELAAFRRGDFRALLVSDLAARGIDVPEVDAVFNLELPTDETHYVHRAGRTGRMGAEGLVLTIVEPREAHVMPRIARRLGVDIRAADLQKGRLVPDRGDKPGVARQAREDGDERDAGRRGDRGGREGEPRPRGDRPSRGGRGGGARGARGEGRGAGGRGGRGAGGRGAASGGGHYTPKGQPRRRTRNASSA